MWKEVRVAGYISLFYDDARENLPNINLQESKQNIYNNFKQVFQKSNPQDQLDLTNIVENTLLTQVESQLQQGVLEGQSKNSNIAYWNVNMGVAHQYISKANTETEKITQSLKYIEEIQQTLSDAIERGNGVIPKSLIEQLHSNKQSLANLANSFGGIVADKGFNSAFYGALRGCVSRAQGVLHEVASVVAAAVAEQYVNEEFIKANQNFRIIVSHTGGSVIDDSNLKAAAQKSNLKLGSGNNSKNDLTIIITDKGTGKVIWNSGLSLKSTTATNPTLVHIVTVSLGTILNKIYSQQTYLNLAGALGKGDWSGTRVGIGALAEQRNLTTDGATLAQQWKQVVYEAIYSQMLDFFSGSLHDGILNNAQYLLINSKPIAMYDIFNKIKSLSETKKSGDFAIPGIEISGASAAANRSIYTRKNISAFVRLNSGISPSEARIERSSTAWSSINSALQDAKIRISLKYAELGLGTTK